MFLQYLSACQHVPLYVTSAHRFGTKLNVLNSFLSANIIFSVHVCGSVRARIHTEHIVWVNKDLNALFNGLKIPLSYEPNVLYISHNLYISQVNSILMSMQLLKS